MMIRTVRAADAEAIAAIYNHYVLETDISFETEAVTVDGMRRRIGEIAGRYPYYVSEEGGEVVGYCYAHPWKERAAYSRTLETTVYVSPDHCGHGVGRQLMQTLIADCRRRGFQALIACITGGNEPSIALHRKLGFRQASHFHNVGEKFGRLLDVVDYELQLQA